MVSSLNNNSDVIDFDFDTSTKYSLSPDPNQINARSFFPKPLPPLEQIYPEKILNVKDIIVLTDDGSEPDEESSTTHDLEGTNSAPVSTQTNENDTLEEDSLFRKFIVCIPVVGILPQIIFQRSLNEKILSESSESSPHAFKAIILKKHYTYCAIVREVLTIAALAMALFFSVLPLAKVAIPLLISSVSIAYLAKQLFFSTPNKDTNLVE